MFWAKHAKISEAYIESIFNSRWNTQTHYDSYIILGVWILQVTFLRSCREGGANDESMKETTKQNDTWWKNERDYLTKRHLCLLTKFYSIQWLQIIYYSLLTIFASITQAPTQISRRLTFSTLDTTRPYSDKIQFQKTSPIMAETEMKMSIFNSIKELLQILRLVLTRKFELCWHVNFHMQNWLSGSYVGCKYNSHHDRIDLSWPLLASNSSHLYDPTSLSWRLCYF
jgi:hypothetical protein